MMRIKSACLEQTLIFDSREELTAYVKRMEKKHAAVKVSSEEILPDGMLCARILRSYVHYPVGEYMK